MLMRFFLILFACAAFACGAARAEPAPHPELVSFADMLRLSAGAPLLPGPAVAQAPVRVTFVQPATTEPRFTVRTVREPGRWMLLLSGVALAGWVAHRRLVSPL